MDVFFRYCIVSNRGMAVKCVSTGFLLHGLIGIRTKTHVDFILQPDGFLLYLVQHYFTFFCMK